AQAVIVVLAPGAGDDIQAGKSGILEIADVFAVNKADLAGADTLVDHLMQERPGTPAVATIATQDKGISELLTAIQSRPRREPLSQTHGIQIDHLGIAVP